MRFSLDVAIYRRMPFESSFQVLGALASHDLAPEPRSVTAPPATHDARHLPAPRWFEMVQGNVSLDDLFR